MTEIVERRSKFQLWDKFYFEQFIKDGNIPLKMLPIPFKSCLQQVQYFFKYFNIFRC